MEYSDDLIGKVLQDTKTIALVGASANPARPAHRVMQWLVERGYRVTAVNPGLAGGTLHGAPVVARLADLGAPADMIDVFRNSGAAGDLVDETLELSWKPKVIWMQLGVVHPAAARRAEAAGITVIMDRCPVIEAGRLGLASPHLA